MLWLLELTVVSVGCFESSRYCTGLGMHQRYFLGDGSLKTQGHIDGSLKAQGVISSWVPALDQKILKGYKYRRAILAGSFNR